MFRSVWFDTLNIMIKKKNILIIFIIGVVIALIYLLISNRSGESGVVSKIPKPKIQYYSTSSIQIESTVTESDFNFPSSLPAIETNSKELETNYIETLAQKLGFSGEPNKAEDVVNGSVYYFNSDDYYMVVYPKIRKIKFGTTGSPYDKAATAQNKQLSDKEIFAIAEKFLFDNLGIDKNDLRYNETKYLIADRQTEVFPETNKESSNVSQLNYSSSLSQYPVITSNPLHSTSYVQILKDGSLLNAEVFIPSDEKLSVEEYSILTYEDYQSLYSSAILVSIDSTNVNLPDFTEETKGKISINRISLAYLLDDEINSVYQPIFVLEGTASIPDFGDNKKAVLYLPAFK